MANFAARDPNYAGPDVRTRWKPGAGGPGRTPTRFLSARLDKPISALDIAKRFRAAATDSDPSVREAFVDRLVEIAFTDEVMVIGRDGDGEPVKRVSSAESINAIKTLWSYDLGKPPAAREETVLKMAEHFRQIAADSVNLALKVLGDRINGMPPDEIAKALRAFATDPRSYLQEAELRTAGLRGELPSPLQAPPQLEENQPDTALASEKGGSDVP